MVSTAQSVSQHSKTAHLVELIACTQNETRHPGSYRAALQCDCRSMGKCKHGKIRGKRKSLMVACRAAIDTRHGHAFVLPQFANGRATSWILNVADVTVAPINTYDSNVIGYTKHSHLITRKGHVEGDERPLDK